MSRRERGMALLLALVALVLVETAGLLLGLALAGRERRHRDEALRLRLQVLADSAAEATVANLSAAAPPALPRQALGGGWIESEVTPLTASRVRILARGELGTAVTSVELEVELDSGAPVVVAWRARGTGAIGSR